MGLTFHICLPLVILNIIPVLSDATSCIWQHVVRLRLAGRWIDGQVYGNLGKCVCAGVGGLGWGGLGGWGLGGGAREGVCYRKRQGLLAVK